VAGLAAHGPQWAFCDARGRNRICDPKQPAGTGDRVRETSRVPADFYFCPASLVMQIVVGCLHRNE